MQANNGKLWYVWATTTAPQIGVILTPYQSKYTDAGLIVVCEFTNQRDANRCASLLLKGQIATGNQDK
jgi:hypothetical protein